MRRAKLKFRARNATREKKRIFEALRNRKYVKLLRNDLTHFWFTYKMGLNVDVLPFDPHVDCKPGGLYFCEPSDVKYHLGGGFTYIADVTIPSNARIVEGAHKCKADRIVLSNMRCLECYLHGCDVLHDHRLPHKWTYCSYIRSFFY
jgi:hypothetical protein